VYSPNQNHTYRVSFSSALRNPTLADQYLYYNVGRAILLGNLNGIDNLVTVASFRNYLALPTPSDTALRFFSVRAIRPEQVRTFEVGYRATFWDKVYVDIGYYYSFYTDFIGYKIGVDLKRNQFAPVAPGTQAYRVAANAEGLITTQGLSVGTNYYFAKKFALNGNYSWNKLNNLGNDDQIIPAFNTPEHKFNIGIGGREFSIGNVNNLGFSANYKWVSEFVFEGSPQFTGIVPQYDLVDAQVNWKWVKYNTTFRLGASNLLNKQVFQVYGGPVIGRLAYFSILFEWDKK
jgi:outer membrane receptor protein involved in Fe transport